MSNKALSALIDSADSRLKRPCTHDDLLSIVQSFRDYDGPLEYSQRPAALFALFFAALIAPMVIQMISGESVSQETSGLMLISAVIGMVMLTCTLMFMVYRSSKIPDLTQRILQCSALINQKLVNLPLPAEQILSALQRDFGDFDRGNYSREITYSVTGKDQGNLHELGYQYHTFKYVNQRTEVVSVSDGKGGSRLETRTVYDTYYRHCVVIDFPWVRNVKVQSDGQRAFKHRVDSAHPDFNRIFTASGANQVECVKFLKPTTILHLLDMANHYGDLNLEFSDMGKLCMSFNNDDILEPYPNKLAMSEPNELYNALVAGISLPKLNYTLDMIHTLAEQHDDNFAQPQKVTA